MRSHIRSLTRAVRDDVNLNETSERATGRAKLGSLYATSVDPATEGGWHAS